MANLAAIIAALDELKLLFTGPYIAEGLAVFAAWKASGYQLAALLAALAALVLKPPSPTVPPVAQIQSVIASLTAAHA